MSCTCDEIRRVDATRHFKGCPERAKHPTPSVEPDELAIRINDQFRNENFTLMREVKTLREQLRQSLNREKILNDNLKNVHERCDELLNEVRLVNSVLRAHARAIVLKGWSCPNPVCGVFNGEEKHRLERCRACDTERPAA